jgi:tetratricopeptide (TPR) repeat protein/ADP-heptose:LPS heptosyltransferase
MDPLLQQADSAVRAGEPARAEALCRQVLARAPGDPDALRLLGIALLEAGRAAEAIAPLRAALGAAPASLATLDALSAALMAVNDPAAAAAVVRRALELDPDLFVAHMRLGLALAAREEWEGAARAFEDAIERDPQVADAHHDLGDALTKLNRPHDAIDCFRRALALRPDHPETHNSLGYALQELGLWGAAAARYERALDLDPAFAKARYNLAIVRLFGRDFGNAWPPYEARLECEPVRATLRHERESLDRYERLPRWRGPEEAGVREVAVWAEQGIGDQILFATLLPELLASGVSVTYEVDRRLLAACERAWPAVRFVPFEDPPREPLQRADRVILAGSLPGLFRRSPEDFARQPQRLLAAAPQRVAHYRDRLAAAGPGLKVALSWFSTRPDWYGRRKNARLADFAPLLELPGTRFVDVQYGDTAAEREALRAATGRELLRFEAVDYFNDLEDLLAILEACDLVVTTSNATAHFAGALGKRTWLLYPGEQPPFHYWAHAGDHRAPWYPSVEIVSAARCPDWPSLIERVRAKLVGEAGIAGAGPAERAGGRAKTATAAAGGPDRARQLRQQGALEEAVAVCRRLLASGRAGARIWNELAHALRWQGEPEQARAAAEEAVRLEPALAEGWFNLGAAQVALGETGRGIASYRKALALRPDFAEAWSNLGNALGATGDKAAEIEAYRQAVAADPGLAPAWSNLGGALLEAGRVGEALAASRRATLLDPAFAPGWNNLGNALRECGEHEEAVRACEAALRLAPDLAGAWSSLGAALHALGRDEEAIRAHRTAAGLAPGDARHRHDLGVTYLNAGRREEAIAALRAALALEPDHAQAHWDLAFALLGAGRLAQGWEEYEWRWRRRGAEPRRHDFEAWDGDRSRPRRLLVWAEQGVGDEILYAGMVPELAASALAVTLEADRRLAPLFRRSFPGVSVIARDELPAAGSAYDCQAPLGSLARWLRPTLDSFPRHAGYLLPDPARAAGYRARLLERGAARVVGIAWRSANREFGAHKSLALRQWSAILGVAGTRFVDLQYGDTAAERAAVERDAGVRLEHLPDLDLHDDLDGLAALCAACDLVITVSNVTAHVAGALGRPVWLLAPVARGRIWYWFAGRRDSPWYPSMRIFEQEHPGDWRPVLDAVARELASFVASSG